MLILNAHDVRQALPMDQTIAAMKRAFAALSADRAVAPVRIRLPVAPHDGVSLFMPAYVQDEEGDSLAVKAVSVFPGNARLGLPIIYAAVLVLEASTGRPLALLEGGTLTAIRTGAGAGAATDLLARADSQVVGILGTGVQARTQLEAVCTVRTIESVRVYSPTRAHVEAFVTEMSGRGPIPDDCRAVEHARAAVAEADIICAATTSHEAVFVDADLKPGVHINGVGAFTPDMQEVPAATVQRALVVVDSREAALQEAGDLIQPIRLGKMTPEDIHAELGELVIGKKMGRSSDTEITFFKSVGVAVQDVAAGSLALANAGKMNLGQRTDW